MRRLLCFIFLALILSVEVCADSDDLDEVWRVCKVNGLSDVSASAIVGNVSAESGGSPSFVEAGEYGRGIGVFQQSNNTNRQSLEDYCSQPDHASHPKVTLRPAKAPKAYVVCDVVECQVNATLTEIAATMDNRAWSKNYNTQVVKLSRLAKGVVDGAIPSSIDVVNSWSGFKEQEDLKNAVIQFQCDYETPGATSCFWVGIKSYSNSLETQSNFIKSFTERYSAALKIYEQYHVEPVVVEIIEPVLVEAEEIKSSGLLRPVKVVEYDRLESASTWSSFIIANVALLVCLVFMLLMLRQYKDLYCFSSTSYKRLAHTSGASILLVALSFVINLLPWG